jgi:hypothetical protein
MDCVQTADPVALLDLVAQNDRTNRARMQLVARGRDHNNGNIQRGKPTNH